MSRISKRIGQLDAYLKQPAFEGVMLRREEIAEIVADYNNRHSVDAMAERLAKIPPEMWAEAQDSNDERVAWRAIADRLLSK